MVTGSLEDDGTPKCAMRMVACASHIVVETIGVGKTTGGFVVSTCANRYSRYTLPRISSHDMVVFSNAEITQIVFVEPLASKKNHPDFQCGRGRGLQRVVHRGRSLTEVSEMLSNASLSITHPSLSRRRTNEEPTHTYPIGSCCPK